MSKDNKSAQPQPSKPSKDDSSVLPRPNQGETITKGRDPQNPQTLPKPNPGETITRGG